MDELKNKVDLTKENSKILINNILKRTTDFLKDEVNKI